ncbi:MAG: DUF1737 domain-containing protein [Chitinivibrionales bacterium]|nr:DUF1737 domain-containing protein [Chitinivibrionales bacterium]MBD3396532.1 DUF1737 domain-containing protein [Chitinivibrionales bacterium]
MEYKLVQSAGSAHELESSVNEYLKQGWQLYGSLAITTAISQKDADSGSAIVYYCQTLTRE